MKKLLSLITSTLLLANSCTLVVACGKVWNDGSDGGDENLLPELEKTLKPYEAIFDGKTSFPLTKGDSKTLLDFVKEQQEIENKLNPDNPTELKIHEMNFRADIIQPKWISYNNGEQITDKDYWDENYDNILESINISFMETSDDLIIQAEIEVPSITTEELKNNLYNSKYNSKEDEGGEGVSPGPGDRSLQKFVKITYDNPKEDDPKKSKFNTGLYFALNIMDDIDSKYNNGDLVAYNKNIKPMGNLFLSTTATKQIIDYNEKILDGQKTQELAKLISKTDLGKIKRETNLSVFLGNDKKLQLGSYIDSKSALEKIDGILKEKGIVKDYLDIKVINEAEKDKKGSIELKVKDKTKYSIPKNPNQSSDIDYYIFEYDHFDYLKELDLDKVSIFSIGDEYTVYDEKAATDLAIDTILNYNKNVKLTKEMFKASGFKANTKGKDEQNPFGEEGSITIEPSEPTGDVKITGKLQLSISSVRFDAVKPPEILNPDPSDQYPSLEELFNAISNLNGRANLKWLKITDIGYIGSNPSKTDAKVGSKNPNKFSGDVSLKYTFEWPDASKIDSYNDDDSRNYQLLNLGEHFAWRDDIEDYSKSEMYSNSEEYGQNSITFDLNASPQLTEKWVSKYHFEEENPQGGDKIEFDLMRLLVKSKNSIDSVKWKADFVFKYDLFKKENWDVAIPVKENVLDTEFEFRVFKKY